MKSLDEPPFLSVGTDVSAKYRGAFCEAKIKSVKRLVKVKVAFRRDGTTVELQDDHIKGPLKVGALVEVKRPDGTYQEAVVSKLTDASWYTVVFDDGDEKTLRRSSLCLKGERHFAESQTLDRLPLTNPEHFGTPVIGKKSNRGRRSNHIRDDESSTSSSEEEEDEEKNGDELLGKVVCVSLSNVDKKQLVWAPALVVSPDCRDDIPVKKDLIFVRAFKDGKFFSIAKTDTQDIADISVKSDCILNPAYEQAMEFIKNKTIPTNWKAELKEEISSSETEDEQEESKEDQEDSSSDDEEEVEPFPGESENFLQQLYKFMEDRGTPINKRPVLGYRNLNLFKLFRLVHKLGGFNNIESGAVWKQVYQDLGIPILNSAAGYNVKCAYKKYLYGFEEYCTSADISFHMDLPIKVAKSSKDPNIESKDLLKQENKTEGPLGEDTDVRNKESVNKETASSHEETQKLDKEKEASSHQEKDLQLKEENVSDKKENPLMKGEGQQESRENIVIEKKEDTVWSVALGTVGPDAIINNAEFMPLEKQDNEKEAEVEGVQGTEIGKSLLVLAQKCLSRVVSRRRISVLKRDDKVENKDTGETMQDKEEEEEFEHYLPSIKPLVRFDDLMKTDKSIRPADKNVPKVKHRRKIKNKSETAHNRSKSGKDENCPKQCRLFSRPLFQPCDLDNELSFDAPECRSISQSPLKPLEITSLLNGLQATENPAEDESEVNQGCQNKTDAVFNVMCIKGDLATRTDGKMGQVKEENYSSADKLADCKSKQAEYSSDDSESEMESSRQKQFVKDFVDKVTRSHKYGKRKFTECEKTFTLNPTDENTKSKETTDMFDDHTLTSSDDEQQPKPKVSLLKKCSSFDDKKKCLRTAGFYSCLQDASDKRPKINYLEERHRAKDRKDVWSSIKGQWPKKTLKELFSDSDTEGASSPPHNNLDNASTDSTFQKVSKENRELSAEFLKPITDAIELKPTEEKTTEFSENKVDFPSSGSNSVLNTPPTTPESTLSPRACRSPQLAAENRENVDGNQEDSETNQEEAESMKSDTNSTTEIDSVTCELPDLQYEGNLSPSAFDASRSSSSSNHVEAESNEKGKKKLEDNSNHVENCNVKKLKRSYKSSVSHKNKIANTSDSEDLSSGESLAKIQSLTSFSGLTSKHTKTLTGMSYPGKYLKNRETCQKEYNDRLPKVYKWSFQLSDLEKMSNVERITFLQEKLQELRQHYLLLKSEVASIDRRRKHSKRKEREGAAMSTIPSSPSSSTVTAAVMLTLAEPSLSSSSQNAMAVECR
ncbi:AT-rich interactive domain-containing protein 4B [Gastrophryne carolinensis]